MNRTSLNDVNRNADVWTSLYREGKADQRYPSDVFVRYCHRHLDRAVDTELLDFGFGTGANLLHLAQLGFKMTGVEISADALSKAKGRLQANGLSARLSLIKAGASLPYPSSSFDAVIAWQVLYYNNWDTWRAAISEMERVIRPGGKVIVATAAPGDLSQSLAEDLGHGLYRSRVPGQEGCILAIPSRDQLESCFPGRTLDVGEFGYRFSETVSRHWLISYRKN